mgnify:CR=1 FL=1
MKDKNYKLFYNGKIITMNDDLPVAGSMIVQGNKITSMMEKKKPGGNYTKKIDLAGKTVLPGFNDSHMHLLGVGESMENIDLNDCKGREDVLNKIEEYIRKNKPETGTWLTGRGWNQNKFSDGRMPDRNLLDRVQGDYPIYLKRVCGHISTANSKALKIAGIGINTSSPSGGQVDENHNGKPTGILRENAMKLVERYIPQPDIDDYKRWIKKASAQLVKNGITSVQTDDFGSKEGFKEIYPLYKKLDNENKLLPRINLQTRIADLAEFKEVITKVNIQTGTGDSGLKIGPCKILADGSLGGRTAALTEPYSDQADSRGTLLYSPEELREFIRYANSAGFQLAIHGIGDRAIRLIINLFKKEIGIKNIPKARPRIIHAQLTDYHLIEQMAELGIAADIQPIFINSDLHIADKRLGRRVDGTYAWKTMFKRGINLAGGSDSPVETYSPLKGIYSAVTRKDLSGYPKEGWRDEEALDLYQAIKIYTMGSAYNTFEENIKGGLSSGMLADFVVLEQDITTVNPDDIKDIEVNSTYIAGKRVY